MSNRCKLNNEIIPKMTTHLLPTSSLYFTSYEKIAALFISSHFYYEICLLSARRTIVRSYYKYLWNYGTREVSEEVLLHSVVVITTTSRMWWEFRLLILLFCLMLRCSFGFLFSSRVTGFSLRRFGTTDQGQVQQSEEGFSSRDSFTLLEKPILLIGEVAAGYGRGVNWEFPANLPYFDSETGRKQRGTRYVRLYHFFLSSFPHILTCKYCCKCELTVLALE